MTITLAFTKRELEILDESLSEFHDILDDDDLDSLQARIVSALDSLEVIEKDGSHESN